jgi:hypothetical protein
MSKADTQYSEKERLVFAKQLDTFNINPFAMWLVAESYIKECHPFPIKYVWGTQGKDLMDDRAESTGEVELYISTAGYLGKKKGNVDMLDKLALSLLCMSYYKGLRPMPVSFQLFGAIEVHMRTPGVTDFDPKNKNPLRLIYNPTGEQMPKKKS